jgi:Flp pilus assembly pilin Flp
MLSFGKKTAQLTARFRDDECGAITVDFVVLTSAITLLGIAVVGAFSGEVTRVANETGDFVASQQITP